MTKKINPFFLNFRALLLFVFLAANLILTAQPQISLNGKWSFGLNRNYTSEVSVPGIIGDPAKMAEGDCWYKKEITLPGGDWSFATLELKGARFLPRVFVNGVQCSKKNGGMATTFHSLNHKSVKPGKTITLEIALSSLKDVPSDDASCIPSADRWRSDITSGLWDDVVLHFHGGQRIERIIPFYDLKNKTISLHFDVDDVLKKGNVSGTCIAEVFGKNGQLLLSAHEDYNGIMNIIKFSYNDILNEWTPDSPEIYRLRLTLKQGKKDICQSEQTIGIKEFAEHDKQFYLNGNPCKLRGGTVVWHRWVRSDEGRTLGYDTDWFLENVLKRLKEHGANYLRFHLGIPPERLLDLCDQYGLLVQFEWSFFHGMPATKESLLEQYPAWLNLAMKHPCIALFHPYNETEGDQLKTVWEALGQILPDYPTLVMEERDVIHVHKYWWSLFENLGLYYDDANQFEKAIIVDEFGGNYLDDKGNLGGYKSLLESNLRFLGRENDERDRLEFQSLSNGKVAEYWRRIGAAGFAPFCIASSWEDGNNWFLGPMKNGNPKPVWNALTAAFSPQSVSLDIWDRDFTPNQQVTIPVYFFNDLGSQAKLVSKITVEDQFGKIYSEKNFTAEVSPYSKISQNVILTVPEKQGEYSFKARLVNRPSRVKYPVVSEWGFRVLKAKIPNNLTNISIATVEGEPELKAFLQEGSFLQKSVTNPDIQLLITSKNTWDKIAKNDPESKEMIRNAIEKGISVVMLDVGDRRLGQGYPDKSGDLGPLQGVARVTNPSVSTYEIFNGISLSFTEAAEPESHLHPYQSNKDLWFNLQKQYTWLWNGFRGGLIVPAADMEVKGLSKKALIEQWKARGADENRIINENYFAYELQGFYRFSSIPDDKEVQKQLKQQVQFLVEDAPALVGSINPLSPVRITNLSGEYQNAANGAAENIIILANAGNNLTRTPVMMIEFGKGKGKLIVSQLLTAGRLNRSFGEPGLYGIRQDEAAVQMVLNMLSETLKTNK